MNTLKLQLQKMDLYLLGISGLLVLIGLLMIYSTTFASGSRSELLPRQLISLAVGLAALFALSLFHYRTLQRLSVAVYILAAASLAGVLAIGRVVKGSTRWFDLGVAQFQPVEFTKLALIIFLAAFFSKHLSRITELRYFLFSLVVAAVPIGLTLMQPDLGSALVLGCIWFSLLIASGTKRRYVVILLLLAMIGTMVSWSMFLPDYQKNRIESFFNPGSDPKGSGYNAIQSITAVGSGGLLGRGFARGVVSQLRFLPERQTDFIFASLAEELGLLGALLLLGLLLLWYIRMLRVVRESQDNFGYFLSLGIFAYLFFQSCVNIGMNIGLLPITGIPLPLVSYGGSSLLASLAAIGILQSVHIRAQLTRFV
ncbi:MAG: rod shape-determining protein RodA [Candidatus Doudnabacteria bacterium RIFCSPHIGHO2_01_FULL_50_11]|uniref:Rod shape-determining protein RodA n=1 Tax=Candidatus Doudnabacteria bacterium RIFCSPHIGHO2_01_FULL_50_11 TaxID=1817828 RepID=A0A1F5PFN0_9BACT|nr:MAG: rod shape-determining protein RodA [Candidatus Doudnabacteria bacterium RIFCSPHIGHO2_01_FULL_50_11]HLC45183.1 rod shape-determining protein RodA [Patescibacteria group bacterium]